MWNTRSSVVYLPYTPESKKGRFVSDDCVPPGPIVLVCDHVVVHHVLDGFIHSVSCFILLREGKVVLKRGRKKLK